MATTYTTVEQVEQALAQKKITAAQAIAALQGLAQNKRIIKRNSSGGLFVRDASFRATSKAGKEYTAGVNVQWEVAVALFGNPELLNAIKAFIDSNPAAPEVDTEAQNAELAKALEKAKAA